MSQETPILPGLSPVERLDIHARFDGGTLSSDGGALLLREIERTMGISLSNLLGERPATPPYCGPTTPVTLMLERNAMA